MTIAKTFSAFAMAASAIFLWKGDIHIAMFAAVLATYFLVLG